jgi:NAD(P)H dehydrogenase (quinone)
MSIVITGATGQLGRLVIADLLAGGTPAGEIAALVRDTDKAADLAQQGVELRVADYNRPETLGDAFQAGDRVLFISSNEFGVRVAQHTAVVEAATKAGVALLAYTGILGGPDADFSLADDHKATEELILASQLPYTFLRNGWYTENYTRDLAAVLEHNAVVGATGDGRIASAARADYAAAAAAVLTGTGHENTAYELSGDVAWTLAEYAAVLAELTGRDIVHRNVTPQELHAILTGAGLPEALAATFAEVDQAIERGRLAATPGTLSRLIGRPTTPFRETVATAHKD